MEKENKPSVIGKLKQRHFVARELQFSIAFLVVLALLGGMLLQAVAAALIEYLGFRTPLLSVVLIIGYIAIVVLIAVFFTHRLIGPFKRLEYEMKRIASGEISKRLSVRGSDDLYVRSFVRHTNRFLNRFEEMSGEYNRLNSTVSTKLEELSSEVARKDIDCELVKKELAELRNKVHEFREKW